MGSTVEELRDRMSEKEFRYWIAFRRLNGPLLPAFRGDWQSATIVQATVGGKLEDHLLKFYDPETQQEKVARFVREFSDSVGAERVPVEKVAVRRRTIED